MRAPFLCIVSRLAPGLPESGRRRIREDDARGRFIGGFATPRRKAVPVMPNGSYHEERRAGYAFGNPVVEVSEPRERICAVNDSCYRLFRAVGGFPSRVFPPADMSVCRYRETTSFPRPVNPHMYM